MLDCLVLARVCRAGGAACAAAIARCARVLMGGGGALMLLRSRVARRFFIRSRLVAVAWMLVGVKLGMLGGGTLGTGLIVVMERVMRLFSSLWCMGMFIGICTLGTCC